MAQTIYTSARNVDVRNCEPQPLIKSNYLAEFRTKLEQAKARQNLGVKDDIIWGNITGDLTLQEDLIECIRQALEYEDGLPVQQKISQIKSELDNLKPTISSDVFLDVITFLNETYNLAGLTENINTFKVEISKNVDTFKKKISGFESKITEFEEEIEGFGTGHINITYNTELESTTEVVNTVGGITSGTKVSDLKDKTFHQLFDMILFPKIDPKPISPTLTVNVPRLVAIDSTVDVEIQYTKNNAGDLKYLTYNGETLIENSSDSTIKQTKTISVNDLTPITVDVTCEYNDGNPLPDNQGNVTDKKVVAGSLSKNIEIKVTYPWYINGVKYVTAIGSTEREIVFTQKSPVIEFPKGSEYTLKADMGAGLNGIVEASWNKEEIDKHGIKYIKLFREWPNPVRHEIKEITIKIGGEQ